MNDWTKLVLKSGASKLPHGIPAHYLRIREMERDVHRGNWRELLEELHEMAADDYRFDTWQISKRWRMYLVAWPVHPTKDPLELFRRLCHRMCGHILANNWKGVKWQPSN